MSKLETLSMNILKSDKLSAENLIKHLVSAIDENISCEDEYRDLYEQVYGSAITRELAESWVSSMESDESSGQKWTVDQCYEVGNKLSIDWNKHNKWEWYTVLNMMYHDYHKTAKALNMLDDTMFFGRLAKDWLCDKDAGENKLFNYYFSVVMS